MRVGKPAPWKVAGARAWFALVLAAALGACGDDAATATAPPESPDGGPGTPETGAGDSGAPDGSGRPAGACAAAPYAASGPFVAGVTTVTLDGSTVELWYPADPGAEAGLPRDVYDMRDWLPAESRPRIPADAPTRFESIAYRDLDASTAGPFPIVLFSHGLGGYRMQSTFLTAHLATWGFVVAAPEHAGRNLTAILSGELPTDDAYTQLLAAHAWLAAEQTRAGGRFEGRLDASRVALMGHSAGGGAVQSLADESELPALAWVALATIGFPERADLPGLVMGGTTDAIAAEVTVRRGYDALAASRKRYLSIAGAGHLAFSDICAIGRERGGVLQIARESGLEVPDLVARLAQDGCRPTDLPAEQAWPLVQHFVTAHLREALGVSDDGLDDGAAGCFGARVETYLHP